MDQVKHLTVSELVKTYNGKAVVNGLSFYVNRGEVVGLLGPNGAGKTTAFYMTIGLIRPDQGTIIFNDHDITKIPIHKRAQMGMGYLAQEPSIFRNLTVEQNIMCILETLKLTSHERKMRLEELLSELNLTHLAKKPAIALSGGERRRLEITRALATNPSFFMLDEPFANIDPISVQEVKDMITHLKNKGLTVLITDHNAPAIFGITDRCYIVQEGKATLSGTPEELMDNQLARSSYLGENFKF